MYFILIPPRVQVLCRDRKSYIQAVFYIVAMIQYVDIASDLLQYSNILFNMTLSFNIGVSWLLGKINDVFFI